MSSLQDESFHKDGRSCRNPDTYFRRELSGQRFGKLVAIRVVGKTKHKNLLWECVCDCGNKRTFPSGKLVSGRAVDCGCETHKRRSNAASKHGIFRDGNRPRTLTIWNGMKARCYNPNSPSYKSYGARGIKICDEWLTFENFHNWAIHNGYSDNLQIDRIDNDKGYFPENCRWVTPHENKMHQRKMRNIEVLGTTHNISRWCREAGISKATAYRYLSKSERDFAEFVESKIKNRKDGA